LQLNLSGAGKQIKLIDYQLASKEKLSLPLFGDNTYQSSKGNASEFYDI
jgi:hypothetical protein